MRTIRNIAAALVLSISVCAVSCVQSQDDSQPAAVPNASESIGQAEPADTSPERIGEAEDPFTRAECYAAWKHNMAQCRTPECWFACSVMLGVCLKHADD
jgi:hypothetical protein